MSQKPTVRGIRACVFDAYGTWFDVHSAVGKHRQRLGDIAEQVYSVWINRFGQRPERLPGNLAAEIQTLSELPALLV